MKAHRKRWSSIWEQKCNNIWRVQLQRQKVQCWRWTTEWSTLRFSSWHRSKVSPYTLLCCFTPPLHLCGRIESPSSLLSGFTVVSQVCFPLFNPPSQPLLAMPSTKPRHQTLFSESAILPNRLLLNLWLFLSWTDDFDFISFSVSFGNFSLFVYSSGST